MSTEASPPVAWHCNTCHTTFVAPRPDYFTDWHTRCGFQCYAPPHIVDRPALVAAYLLGGVEAVEAMLDRDRDGTPQR